MPSEIVHALEPVVGGLPSGAFAVVMDLVNSQPRTREGHRVPNDALVSYIQAAQDLAGCPASDG